MDYFVAGDCSFWGWHVLCEKQGKVNEAYKKLQDGWLDNGDKVPPAEFAKIAQEYSECPSGKKGGDLGWHGYHIILCEGRKN
ncbi:hypothetical protein GUJ93_ZPchr0002g23726 [Zizania palustris]|uniref:Peptidyl-prolyl cis-trans isomerase n=1 Tax=Zizania palustris TaxID=103762 RepID=A0A8J5RMG4_ZIZPA|nr:hypothetical protein GUJ93_ZPchr0002g23726 [Zizania palustris]